MHTIRVVLVLKLGFWRLTRLQHGFVVLRLTLGFDFTICGDFFWPDNVKSYVEKTHTWKSVLHFWIKSSISLHASRAIYSMQGSLILRGNQRRNALRMQQGIRRKIGFKYLIDFLVYKFLGNSLLRLFDQFWPWNLFEIINLDTVKFTDLAES